MSTSEYYDMFIERQDKGNYHMFVFDILNSKKNAQGNKNKCHNTNEGINVQNI